MEAKELAKIARNSTFQARVAYFMMKKAQAVFSGGPPPNELGLVHRILSGREPTTPWALAVVTNATIAAGNYDVEGSSITDSVLEAQVSAQWPSFV